MGRKVGRCLWLLLDTREERERRDGPWVVSMSLEVDDALVVDCALMVLRREQEMGRWEMEDCEGVCRGDLGTPR